jgi:hypothetical protein
VSAKATHLIVGEAADDGAVFQLLRRRTGLGQGDYGRKVLHLPRFPVGDMDAAIETHDAGGEDPGLVGLPGRHEAVGGEEHRAAEGFDVLGLGPPGAAVVSIEVVVFLEEGVIVGGEHLAVGVYIDTRALVCSSRSCRSTRSWPEMRIPGRLRTPVRTLVILGLP